MTESTSILSSDLHEIGTRLVDLLNQTGFLYRFPDLAGVTLACIAQHIEPIDRLLDKYRDERESLGRQQSADGYSIGDITRLDPIQAAFDYTLEGYGAFVRHFQRLADADPELPASDRQALMDCLPPEQPRDPAGILECKDLIDARSGAAIREAVGEFQPLAQEDWQGFRMVLFFFLIELQKSDG